MDVLLGFIEKKSKPIVSPFISKIGGKPVILIIYLKNFLPSLPSLSALQVKCQSCDQPMILLMQLYAPDEEAVHAYDRVLYIFICQKGICFLKHFDKAVKVLRANQPEISDQKERSLCRVCGLLGDKMCSKCQRVKYCSKEHQNWDWQNGNHKENCSTGADSKSATFKLFPEYEVVSEVEPEKLNEETLMSGNSLLSATAGETFEESKCQVDKTFLKFQKRIQRAPGQVLRYQRALPNETDIEPLWISDLQKPQKIPACSHCGAKRTFECQIMPSLLNHLQIQHSDPYALDFGTLLIYSCSKSCDLKGKYAEEVIFHQPLSSDGLSINKK